MLNFYNVYYFYVQRAATSSSAAFLVHVIDGAFSAVACRMISCCLGQAEQPRGRSVAATATAATQAVSVILRRQLLLAL